MSPVKLLLMDLDDTLLGRDGAISPANRAALAAAMARGVRVTLASGRMFRSMRPYAEEIDVPATLPVIAYNGALGRSLDGTTIWHEPLPNPTARALLSFLAGRDLTVHLFLDDRLYVKEIDERVRLYMANSRVEAEPVGDLTAFLGNGCPTKILNMGDPAYLRRLQAELTSAFGARVESTFSRPYFLEIMAPGISKAAGLRRLAGHLGVALEETMAIGDGPNDLGMLLEAGIGVAVGNAPPEVLARAPYTTGPSDRDGVAEAIRRFVIG